MYTFPHSLRIPNVNNRFYYLNICDKFTDKNLFKTDDNGNLLRDEADNIEKLAYDN